MIFEKRQNVLIRESRFILWGFLISLFFINILLFQLFLVASQKGASLILNEFHLMITGIVIWFFCLFVFSKEWQYYKYFKFICRIDREIRELILGERNEIIFREGTKWLEEDKKIILYEKLEENKNMERILLFYVDKIKLTIKNQDIKEFFNLKEELNKIIAEKK